MHLGGDHENICHIWNGVTHVVGEASLEML
jgi:hypothetical protein